MNQQSVIKPTHLYVRDLRVCVLLFFEKRRVRVLRADYMCVCVCVSVYIYMWIDRHGYTDRHSRYSRSAI